jgi:hypothetical protein
MAYTMEDFRRDYAKEHFPELPLEDQQEVIQKLPAEIRLAGLSEEQIQEYLNTLRAKSQARKPRRKKK